MDLGISVSAILQFMFPTIFAFWPLLLAAPLTWNRTSINQIIALWIILLLIRFIMFFLPGSGFMLINEPLNTILFVGAGLILFSFVIVQRRRRKEDQPIK